MGKTKTKTTRKPAPRAAARKSRGATSRPPAKQTTAPEMQPGRSRGPADGVGRPHDANTPYRDVRNQTEATWIDNTADVQLMPNAPAFVRWGLGVYKLGLLIGFAGDKASVRVLKVNERGGYVAEFGEPLFVARAEVSRVYMERDWEGYGGPGEDASVDEHDARQARGPLSNAHGNVRTDVARVGGKETRRDIDSIDDAVHVAQIVLNGGAISAWTLFALARWVGRAAELLEEWKTKVQELEDSFDRRIAEYAPIDHKMREDLARGGDVAPSSTPQMPDVGLVIDVIGDDPARPGLWHRAHVTKVDVAKGKFAFKVFDRKTSTIGASGTERVDGEDTRWRRPASQTVGDVHSPAMPPAPRDVAPSSSPKPKLVVPPGTPATDELISVRTGGQWEVVTVTGFDGDARGVTFVAADDVEGVAKMSDKDRTWRELSNAERARHQKPARTVPVQTHPEMSTEQLARNAEAQRVEVDKQGNDAALEAAGGQARKTTPKQTPVERAVDHAKIMPRQGHAICIMALGNWTTTKVAKIRDVDKFEVLGGLVLSLTDHGTSWIHVHEVPRREERTSAPIEHVVDPAPSVSAPAPLTLHKRNMLAAKRLRIPLDEVVRRREEGTLELGPEDREADAEARRASDRARAGLDSRGMRVISETMGAPIDEPFIDERPDADELAIASDRELEALGKRRMPNGDVVDDVATSLGVPQDLDYQYQSDGRMPWEA